MSNEERIELMGIELDERIKEAIMTAFGESEEEKNRKKKLKEITDKYAIKMRKLLDEYFEELGEKDKRENNYLGAAFSFSLADIRMHDRDNAIETLWDIENFIEKNPIKALEEIRYKIIYSLSESKKKFDDKASETVV